MRKAQVFVSFLLLVGVCRVTLATDLGAHAKIGALLGEKCDNEFQAFAAGIASHDILDHLIYGTTLYDEGSMYNTGYLGPVLIVNFVELRQVYKQYRKTKDKKLLWGTIGGMLPDIADSVYHGMMNRDGYLFGWHGRRSTWLVSDPPGPRASRKAARWNLLIGATVWSLKF